jgi:hypothetical protein
MEAADCRCTLEHNFFLPKNLVLGLTGAFIAHKNRFFTAMNGRVARRSDLLAHTDGFIVPRSGLLICMSRYGGQTTLEKDA